MSVWTEVQGVVRLKKNSKFSFATYIEEHFMEATPKIQQTTYKDYLVVDFKFNFSDSNLAAAIDLNNFVKKIKEHDKNAWVDIYANIRFLA